jgi:hypothetical protein
MVIYMMSKILTLDYRGDEARILFEIKAAYLSQIEIKSKKTSDNLKIEKVRSMVPEVDEKVY